MSRTTIYNAILLAIFVVCGYILITNPPAESAQAPVFGECQQWAVDLDQAFLPDSPIMHSVGCDEGRLTEGVYVRVDGPCNEAARRGYRNGLEADSPELIEYVESFGCTYYDDGTYGEN